MRGTTGNIVVVVSPLVNLMKDQFLKLAIIGIPAVTLNNISKANMKGLSILQKIKPIFAEWSLVRDPWPWWNYISQNKRKRPLFRGMFWKSSLHTFTSSLFLILRIPTEFLVIVFDRAENCFALVWETVVWSLSKKSTSFYTHNNFQKNCTADYGFIASFVGFFLNVWVVLGRR